MQKIIYEGKKIFYSKMTMNELTDNLTFWKAITPFLFSKATWSSKITLIEKEAIILLDQKAVKIRTNFFE